MYPFPVEPPSPPPSHRSRSSQSARLGSLCCIATSYQLSIIHMVVYVCHCCFLHLPHPLLPPLWPQVHSLLLCLHFFPANRFISTISRLPYIYEFEESLSDSIFSRFLWMLFLTLSSGSSFIIHLIDVQSAYLICKFQVDRSVELKWVVKIYVFSHLGKTTDSKVLCNLF